MQQSSIANRLSCLDGAATAIFEQVLPENLKDHMKADVAMHGVLALLKGLTLDTMPRRDHSH